MLIHDITPAVDQLDSTLIIFDMLCAFAVSLFIALSLFNLDKSVNNLPLSSAV